MSLLDQLLGDTNVGATIATDPALGVTASDVHVGGDSLVSIGDLGLALSAPTFIGVSASSEADAGSHDSGGLLGGLLGGVL